MKNTTRASLLLLLALAAPASAEMRFSGYLKNLYQYSHGTLDDRPYFLDTARARLTFDGNAGPATAHADFDNQLAAGSFFRTRDFKAYGYSPPKPWLSMEHTVSTGVTNGYGIGAYRAYVGLEGDRGVVRAGRQR
ncbi:MAG: porin, partial [Elusimicrobia bacterium]|nr:porin [Elusimicrobiota bacterium]